MKQGKMCKLLQTLIQLVIINCAQSNWDDWWTYDGISGPDFWGLLNPEWHLCSKGKRQSPIDIKPPQLLYDPSLRPLQIDPNKVSGILENNGHGIIFRVQEQSEVRVEDNLVEESSVHIEAPPNRIQLSVNITGGPLSYSYTFSAIYLHFGRTDNHGSEHSIGGLTFPAELQIIGYNSDLYQNISDASNKANGLVAIALLIQVGNSSNMELNHLISLVQGIRFRGQNTTVKGLSVGDLLPERVHYMTYEGSLTVPGCHETVTWVIANKPATITAHQLFLLRKLMQGESDLPKAPLGNNFRPLQPLNARFVRTNIDFRRRPGEDCPTMRKNMHYQVNSKHIKI
ncbi:carbonic anhydrase-related protein 10-like [Tetranychus urticae]|uniref:Alpha-carbonic anhydrase domain-containing protein n=1 Tax=Tetranychus urticae TaxID=32264 RepID=T1KBL7_TETUR|nr:carbonic anhydrase-related protein 10-like [Tetranychus urticae]XP_015784736.1 carbonic anhydrase-related protein 10-like [Tetranychus urticae]XP_015784737.1 carbonic anhydrase-related protein 10-like [Tetranychus urticae]